MLKRIIIPVMICMVAASGAFAVKHGTAGAAVSYNRVTMSCAKTGFDARLGKFRKQVDPIVAPGAAQSAHLHDFYGRLDIGPNSAAIPVLRAGFETDPGDLSPAYSNCNQNGGTYGDWAAYWAPTPKFAGTTIPQGSYMLETWQAPVGEHVETPPFGMLYVAGLASATSPQAHVRFTCGNIDGVNADHPIDCSGVAGGVVTGEVTFPDCWDGYGKLASYQNGVRPSTYDHPAGLSPNHFFYSTDGKCATPGAPCVMGVKIAQLILQFTFIDPRTGTVMVNPNDSAGVNQLTFSSGQPFTFHADLFLSWNHVLNDVINAYLNNGPLPPGTRVDNLPIQ